MKQISGKDFCRVVEHHGWILRRINGSHHIYTRTGRVVRLSIPVHANRPLKLGLLRSLLKQAALTETDI